MNIQETLLKLADYNASFRIFNGNTIVGITYPEKWQILKPNNKEIIFDHDLQDVNTYYYCAPLSLDIMMIFDCINLTITFNQELELKTKLFQRKIKELQTIFTEQPLEILNTLTFEFNYSKKKKKQNSNHKIDKEKTKEEEVVVEKTNEETLITTEKKEEEDVNNN